MTRPAHRPARPELSMTEQLSVRFTAKQMKAIKRQARLSRVGVRDWVRSTLNWACTMGVRSK